MTTAAEERIESSPRKWHDAVAGAVAGAGARLATAPLDLLKIRRQLDTARYPGPSLWSSWTRVVREEGGFSALFRGTAAATYLWIGYSSVQFLAYARAKGYLEGRMDPFATAFASGAAAGCAATAATYPFDFCRTIFAARGLLPPTHSLRDADPLVNGKSFEPPVSLRGFVASLYRQRGIGAFYAGIGPALVQIVPYMGLNFAIYDRLASGDRGVASSAYAGTVSGITSKVIVYPLDTVKRRLQSQAVFGPAANGSVYEGLVDCFRQMSKNEGVKSLYRGMLPSVLKNGIATGLSFSLYRWSKNLLERIH